jgi:hypothetical protein
MLCVLVATCVLLHCYWSETTPRQWICISTHGDYTCWHSARDINCNRQAGARAFITKP